MVIVIKINFFKKIQNIYHFYLRDTQLSLKLVDYNGLYTTYLDIPLIKNIFGYILDTPRKFITRIDIFYENVCFSWITENRFRSNFYTN